MPKQKRVIKDMECLNQSNTANGSNVSLVLKEAKQPSAVPGQPQRIIAIATAQFNFKDQSGKDFEPGKKYNVTIEEA